MESVQTIYFGGPSLWGCVIEKLANESWRPPVERGDVYRCTLEHPKQIVLIDGRFNQVFSVWHKEILFALSEGVRVIGAASMGAIRAAEMWRYGMIGIGEIFEAYRSGAVEDDAWVAMAYDPETFEPLTEPPCGQATKQRDAFAAVALARALAGEPFSAPFSRLSVQDLVTPVLERIDSAYGQR